MATIARLGAFEGPVVIQDNQDVENQSPNTPQLGTPKKNLPKLQMNSTQHVPFASPQPVTPGATTPQKGNVITQTKKVLSNAKSLFKKDKNSPTASPVHPSISASVVATPSPRRSILTPRTYDSNTTTSAKKTVSLMSPTPSTTNTIRNSPSVMPSPRMNTSSFSTANGSLLRRDSYARRISMNRRKSIWNTPGDDEEESDFDDYDDDLKADPLLDRIAQQLAYLQKPLTIAPVETKVAPAKTTQRSKDDLSESSCSSNTNHSSVSSSSSRLESSSTTSTLSSSNSSISSSTTLPTTSLAAVPLVNDRSEIAKLESSNSFSETLSLVAPPTNQVKADIQTGTIESEHDALTNSCQKIIATPMIFNAPVTAVPLRRMSIKSRPMPQTKSRSTRNRNKKLEQERRKSIQKDSEKTQISANIINYAAVNGTWKKKSRHDLPSLPPLPPPSRVL